MINRLKHLQDEPPEDSPATDYYEVCTDFDSYCVSRETAERVARDMERRWPPRWIRFDDLFGAEVRVRSRTIRSICECTSIQRQTERSFRRARRQEEKKDRSWDDDDW